MAERNPNLLHASLESFMKNYIAKLYHIPLGGLRHGPWLETFAALASAFKFMGYKFMHGPKIAESSQGL